MFLIDESSGVDSWLSGLHPPTQGDFFMDQSFSWIAAVLVPLLLGFIQLKNVQHQKDRDKQQNEIDKLKMEAVEFKTRLVTEERVREIVREIQEPLKDEVGEIGSNVNAIRDMLMAMNTTLAVVKDRVERNE